MPDTFDPALDALLRFYAEAGYDEALDETPHNRLESPPVAPARSPLQGRERQPALITAPARPEPTVPTGDEAERARELARSAESLDALRALVEGFDGCNLKFTAKQLVFGDGNPAADIMFVGEAPGREEDLEGLPFVGRSGQLLDKMLAAIGLDRTSAYIANVIPWRPPGNRDPSALETEICRPFVERQIELVAPRILVTLGGPSTKVILDTKDGIMRVRGKWRVHKTAGGHEIPAMPTLHPAYLLRNPAHKKLAWRDLLEAKVKLKQPG